MGIQFQIKEANSDHPEVIQKGEVVVENNDLALCIHLDGYGLMNCQPKVGGPILVERYEGKLRLLVWADINQEDPTHIIDLEPANESNRQEEELDSIEHQDMMAQTRKFSPPTIKSGLYNHDELKALLISAGVSEETISAEENEGSLGLEDLATKHLGACDYIEDQEQFHLKQ